MQQLQNASDPTDPLVCAAGVLEAVLDVMLMIREQTARRHHDRPSLIHVRAMGVLRKRPGATLSALSDQLALTLSATSRLVECLVEKGLVARIIPQGNRRTVSLHLTPAGRKSLTKSLHHAQRELAQTLRHLAPAQRHSLNAAMALLSHTLNGKDPQPHRRQEISRGSGGQKVAHGKPAGAGAAMGSQRPTPA